MNDQMLSSPEIEQLTRQACTAEDWKRVRRSASCDLSRIRNTRFFGDVRLGANGGTVQYQGIDLPCGIYDAAIGNSTVGDSVRIANIGVCIDRYHIADHVHIENVGAMTCDGTSAFGNGTEIDVWNEAGGRGIILLNKLTAQTAYLQAARRHEKVLTQKLRTLFEAEAVKARSEFGTVGANARIVSCLTLRNVMIGPSAILHGVQILDNGTILSSADQPTVIGPGVQGKDFVIAEGAKVEGAALVERSFIGQGTKMGKQYSAENSAFFANCEAFHGEAVALFAGPYTVTHHKSTLLIAGLFSFYNAGSGTNQSNHMYKLGPVHQGTFERGSKTGSFSYVLFESRVGAFSVVIGKHMSNINTPNLPFSYIYEKSGESFLVPGMNILSVGTVRDGEKWPKRDNRKVRDKRDLIVFDVYSPYTVEKMRLGRAELLQLSENTPKERDNVLYGGVQISRLLLRKGAKYYGTAVTMYLADKVLARLAASLETGARWTDAVAALTSPRLLSRSSEWTDLCGLLAPAETVRALEADISSGTVGSYDDLLARLQSIHSNYVAHEWQYVTDTFPSEYGYAANSMTAEQALALVDEWFKASSSILSAVVEDAKKEFGTGSRIGYGLDLDAEAASADFDAVRGTPATNAVVQKLTNELNALKVRSERLKALIEKHSS
jgi:hypothetical protein